jgi:hypothetical protein
MLHSAYRFPHHCDPFDANRTNTLRLRPFTARGQRGRAPEITFAHANNVLKYDDNPTVAALTVN